MNYPTIQVVNFFENPDYILNYAESLEYEKKLMVGILVKEQNHYMKLIEVYLQILIAKLLEHYIRIGILVTGLNMLLKLCFIK